MDRKKYCTNKVIYNPLEDKQDIINNLNNIISNANTGANDGITISNYGYIVIHDSS